MASSGTVRVLDHSRIAPPPGSLTDRSLPLTFFDIPWLHYPLLKLYFFFKFSHPKPYFLDSIVPRLKRSLSLALYHFFPLSGNLIFPSTHGGGMPQLLYKDGDSVSLTFAECGFDFDHLRRRNDIDSHSLAVEMSPTSTNSGQLIAPLLAIQLTLFPNSGICIGFTLHHIAADGNTFFRFARSWAFINKRGGDRGLILPFYDRTVVNDPIGLRSTFWNHFGKIKYEGRPPPQSTDKVRATFVLRRREVEELKKWVFAQTPGLSSLSTFTVICGYVWSCVIRARSRRVENELEYFAFTADCRRLLDPPLPAAYFGNCLMGALATAKSTELIGEDGVLVAVRSIQMAMEERVWNKEGVLAGVQKWVQDSKSLDRTRLVAVLGSPRFDVYDMDFGLDLGRAKRFEVISRDSYISLNGCEANDEDFEVGLCLSDAEMDAFGEILTNGFKVYSCL